MPSLQCQPTVTPHPPRPRAALPQEVANKFQKRCICNTEQSNERQSRVCNRDGWLQCISDTFTITRWHWPYNPTEPPSKRRAALVEKEKAAVSSSSLPCVLSQSPPRTLRRDVFPVPVFPTIITLFPCEILRLKSLMSSLPEDGTESVIRSRRKAVSLGTGSSPEWLLGHHQDKGGEIWG